MSISHLDPLKMDGVELLMIMNLTPEVCIDMLKRTNWTVEERIRQNIIQAIKDRGMFENPTQADFEKAIAINAIMAIRCHISHADKFIRKNPELVDVKSEWILVIHEMETGTLYNNISQTGQMIYMPDHPNLLKEPGLVEDSFPTSDNFTHKVFYNPHD